ncbi:MAG: glycosyltransferase family 4 protein [Alphaproteobacteria bacterium]|nr:glycosyltransferase family 4 protein [Alphaproteobacteria bacterium]
MRKVAIILPPRESFAPDSTGAIGLLVHRLARHPGLLPSVVLGIPSGRPFADAEFVAVPPSWFPGNLARRYAGGVAAALRRIGPAAIEVHNRPDVALFLARRCPGVPVRLLLHNDPQGMRGLKSARERAGMLTYLAAVTTVSEHLRRRYLDGITGDVSVLPNCIDLAEIPKADARENLILFAGRVVSDKGADSFVAACGLALPGLPGWRAEIIGADRFGPDSPETPWLATLRPKAAAAGVAMRGYRPHADVLAAMAHAAIVVVPSRWDEPFGLTALEAMACGAALIASARGGLPEVYGDAALAIDPENPADIAAALTALATDPARRAALAEAGHARAAQFDVAIAARRLDALRSDVLAA